MGWLDAARLDGQVETPFFFGREGRRKFAVLHRPESAATGDPILVCHPHFEEKLWAHRVLLDFARRAAARGHVVLRFDAGGHGDSEGEFEEFGYDALEDDAAEAWDLLRERDGREPVAVGLRLGGTLAGRVAARRGGRAALWEPVVDPKEWLLEAMRAHLTFQLRQHGKVIKNRKGLVADLEAGGTVVLEGYGLTGAFWREAAASGGLLSDRFPARCSGVLAIALSRRPVAEAAPLSVAVNRWKEILPTAYTRIAEDAFWSDIHRYRTRSPELVEATLGWIEGRELPETAA